jgi:hypothetical protein
MQTPSSATVAGSTAASSGAAIQPAKLPRYDGIGQVEVAALVEGVQVELAA